MAHSPEVFRSWLVRTTSGLTTTGPSAVGLDLTVERVLRTGGLRTRFQPIVDLSGRRVVGWEALTRGPRRTALEAPDRLFAAAREAGRTAELDWACRCQAFRAARSLRPPVRLFVNAEPQAFARACPPHLVGDWLTAHRRLRVVVELTERHLLEDPAGLLRARATLRELGWEMALDDVGATDAGVALLPLLRPDVVKLDRPVLAPGSCPVRRAVLMAVRRYAHTTGAPIVAEGIETAEQHRRAVEIGADWGQGYLFARPGPLPPSDKAQHRSAGPPVDARVTPGLDDGPDARVATDPFVLLHGPVSAVRRAGDAVAVGLRDVLRDAETAGVGALLVVVAGQTGALPVWLDEALDRLSGPCALVALLTGPAARSRSLLPRLTELGPTDQVGRDTAVVLLAPDRARAVYARPDGAGGWGVVRDDDPKRVADAARSLLARLAPAGPEHRSGRRPPVSGGA